MKPVLLSMIINLNYIVNRKLNNKQTKEENMRVPSHHKQAARLKTTNKMKVKNN